MTVPASLTTISNNPSADQSSGPFEGPEKLLELWFAPSLEDLPTSHASSSTSNLRIRQNPPGAKGELMGLRKVPREVWEEMLSIVQCKVLSVVEGDELDAYLLRWVSSLLVSRRNE
jgi:S-adenosylmethionine decarboxylase